VIILRALVLLLLAASLQAQAQPTISSTNGCGTEGSGALVPDETFFSRCSFTQACNAHDTCYGRCLIGGDLHGQETCADEQARRNRRVRCDAQLYLDIVEQNSSRPLCTMYGHIYRWAVETFGLSAFSGAFNVAAEISTIERFATYASLNTNAFDQVEVTNAFRRLATLKDYSYFKVIFDEYQPRLIILATNREARIETVVDLLGVAPDE